MNIALICAFCGTDRNDDSSSCESCGANTLQKNQQEIATAEGLAQSFSLALKDARKSRVYLTGTALLFAMLFGIFWQKAQLAPVSPTKSSQSYSEQALALASVPNVNGGVVKKAMFASAMMDVSVVKFMVHDYYLDAGKFPASLSDLKLDADSMISRNVEELKIEEAGVMSVRLTQGIGDNMVVTLVPELVMGGSNIEWSCFSNLPPVVLAGTHCETMRTPVQLEQSFGLNVNADSGST